MPALAAAEQQLAEYQGPSAGLLQALLNGWWQQIGNTHLGGVVKLIISESRNFPDVAQYYHDRDPSAAARCVQHSIVASRPANSARWTSSRASMLRSRRCSCWSSGAIRSASAATTSSRQHFCKRTSICSSMDCCAKEHAQ